MRSPLILIGGGGHAKACIDVIEEEGQYDIKGIIDLPEKINSEVLKYKITGSEDEIPALVKQGYFFLITIGQIKSASQRVRIWLMLSGLNANVATIISPFAHVSKYAKVNKGSIVMHGAYINADAIVGHNNIINTAAIIEHDTVTGDHCHISTGAILNGNCVTGNEVFVGSQAVINQGLTITDNVKIGSGSLIHRNIKEEGTYAGIPFMKIV